MTGPSGNDPDARQLGFEQALDDIAAGRHDDRDFYALEAPLDWLGGYEDAWGLHAPHHSDDGPGQRR